MSLAETLAQAWASKKIVGVFGAEPLPEATQADKEATIGVTDGLVHLFANRWAPLVAGRNLGLMAMELFIPARDVLAQRTLGWVAR
jgi:2-octaprenyl-6-methoxyphenol hydroxylase